ncbi:MAG: DUF4872 domain-containing protein, partial [Candidatus Dadabacteria bacterium]|nr:DUF4872 domain-containing protein [Candidatus Dadabacteria bacterium]
EKFYLADTGFEDLQLVSYEHIKKARSSKVKPYPLSNNWLDIDLSEQNIDIEAAIPDALVKNAEMMLQGYTTLRGKSGVDIIKKWSDDLPDWRLIDDWKWSSRFSYQVISKRGVDGAGFRWFYRDFLSESSTYCPKINELDLVAMMDNIGNKWFDLSMLLKEISELDQPNGKFTEASSIANEIFTLEKDFYNLIINSINKI